MTTLRYDIAVVGGASIARALAGIEQKIAAHNSRVNAIIARGGGLPRSVGGAADGGVSVPRAARVRGLSEEERAARAAAKASEQSAKAQAKAEREKTRTLEKEQRERIKLYKQEAKELDRRAEAALAASQKPFGNGKIAMQRDMARPSWAARGAYRALSGMGDLAWGALKLGGGMAMAAGIYGDIGLRRSTAALANQAFNTPATRGKSREQLQSEIDATARATRQGTGFSAEQVVSGMSSFHALAGNVNAAKNLAPFMAQMALASEASLEDIGTTAGQTFMNALSAGMDPKQAEQATKAVLAAAAGQAKVGAIEMKDVAAVGSGIIASASLFSGDFGANAQSALALAQMSRGAGGADSAAEAATSVASFTRDLIKHGSALEKMGVQVYAPGSNRMKLGDDVGNIAMQAIAATKGDLSQLSGKHGFDARGIRAVLGLQKAYANAGGGDAGILAMKREFKNWRDQTMSPAEVSSSAAFAANQPGKQLADIWHDVTETAGHELAPAFLQLAGSLKELMPMVAKAISAFATFASWAAENPLKGLGAIILGAVAKDVAAAGIGQAIRASLGLETAAKGAGSAASPWMLPVAAAAAAGTYGWFKGKTIAQGAGFGSTGQNLMGGAQAALMAGIPVSALTDYGVGAAAKAFGFASPEDRVAGMNQAVGDAQRLALASQMNTGSAKINAILAANQPGAPTLDTKQAQAELNALRAAAAGATAALKTIQPGLNRGDTPGAASPTSNRT